MQKNNQQSDINEILSRIKQYENISSDYAIAKLLGTPKQNVYSWIRRNTIPYKELYNYCSKKNLNINYFLAGEGNPEVPRSVYMPAEKELIPILGIAEAGAGICNVDQGYPPGISDEWISRPYGVKDPKAFGIRIEGDSMSPKYDHGQRVIVSPNINIHSKDKVLVVLKDDEAIICEIHFIDDKVKLVKFNADDIEVNRADIKKMYKIIWTKEL